MKANQQKNNYFPTPFTHAAGGAWDYIMTANGDRAFDFTDSVSREYASSIVIVLNEEMDHIVPSGQYTYKDGSVHFSMGGTTEEILSIRSWGRLTGGLKLSVEKATVIQDQFGQWIVDTLNNKEMLND